MSEAQLCPGFGFLEHRVYRSWQLGALSENCAQCSEQPVAIRGWCIHMLTNYGIFQPSNKLTHLVVCDAYLIVLASCSCCDKTELQQAPGIHT